MRVKLVPESRDPRPGAFDLPGAGLSVATLVASAAAPSTAPPLATATPQPATP